MWTPFISRWIDHQMTLLRRTTLALALFSIIGYASFALAQPEPQPAPAPPVQGAPEQIEEFVPFEGVPPEDQIPAANLLIPAYALVWIGVFLYVLTVARRLGTVQREVERLEGDIKAGKRA